MHFTVENYCDSERADLCFEDRSVPSDGDFWDPGETPQTGLKQVVVKLYDTKGRVARTETFFHSLSGLTSEEFYADQNTLTMRIPWGHDFVATRGTDKIKEHLEYKSLFGFKKQNFRGGVENIYIRTGTTLMTINQSVLYNDPIQWNPNVDLGSLTVHLETALVGEIQVFPYIRNSGTSSNFRYDVRATPDMDPYVSIPLVRQTHLPVLRDGLFVLDHTSDWLKVQNLFHDPALSPELNGDSYPYIILRKILRDENGNITDRSALRYVNVDWDVNPPFVSTAPVPNPHYTRGLNPLLQVGIEDPYVEDNGGLMRTYQGAQSFSRQFFSFIIRKKEVGSYVQIATAMWSADGATTPYSVSYLDRAGMDAASYAVQYRKLSLRLVNKDELPATLPDYGDYQFTCEFADQHFLKSSHTWESGFWEGTPGSAPTVSVSTHAGDWSIFANPNSQANPTVVTRGTTVNFRAILMSDDQWGILWETVTLEDCTPGASCLPILSYSGPNPGNYKYGLYFDFGTPDNPQTRFSNKATYAFSSTGIHRIKVSGQNTDGQSFQETNAWYIDVH